MVPQATAKDIDLEKRMSQLEDRVAALEAEVNRLKSKLDSHYIE